MKERPILFNAPMVRAILANTKTQTRRVVKMPNSLTSNDLTLTRMQDGYSDGPRPVFGLDDEPNAFSCKNPYGQPGEQLWVRETWRTDARLDDKAPNEFSGWPVKYEADSAVLNHGAFFGQTDGKTRTSIHMPRWASRITLEVTGVRVETLQDISEADAVAEGCKPIRPELVQDGLIVRPGRSAVEEFRLVWEQIHGGGSWEKNPFVWVVTFRRIDHA